MASTETYVLGADIGGTNTKIALARVEDGHPTIVKRATYASRAYAGVELVLEVFLAEPDARRWAPNVVSACLAVAGAVDAGRTRLTNLSWDIEAAGLARSFGFPRVSVINDFAAAGLGITLLAERDLLVLQEGAPVERGPRVVVGAGTGLGVSFLHWEEGAYAVHASEAGHCDFAPVDALQDDLLGYLRREFGRVSYERVVSGPGLARIFDFLEATGAGTPGPALTEALRGGDPSKGIAELALGKVDPLAERALDLFVSAYGAFAGDMALTALARGGVFIAGGIAPKIAAKLGDGIFMRAFVAKGRFKALLETIPVKVVLNSDVGLYGALAEAIKGNRTE